MQGRWCSGECGNSFGIGLWKEIRKDWEVLLLNAKFVIGDGSRVGFWKDVWVGEEALCRAFPTLFSLVVRKEALIREVWTHRMKADGPLVLVGLLMIEN